MGGATCARGLRRATRRAPLTRSRRVHRKPQFEARVLELGPESGSRKANLVGDRKFAESASQTGSPPDMGRFA